MAGDARGGRFLHGRASATARFHALNGPKNSMHAKQVERRSITRPVRRPKFYMTSAERHQARYERRKAARAAKRQAAIAEYDNFDRMCTANALYRAARQSRKSIRWKESVQRYFMSYMRNILNLRDKMRAGEDVTMGFIEFDLKERGKRRHIKSVHFKERVAQRTLCDNALIPVLSRSLIYDNGASLEGKGIGFTRNRLKHHLHQFYRRTGSNEGYILLMDFTGYFDNILHEPVYELLDKAFSDKRIVEFCRQFIECFGEKSLGIGSQISQILAISYRNSLDHYVKEVLRALEYAAYMDDSYLMDEDKDRLWARYQKIREKCAERGILINPRKTQIVKISHGFTFMKGKYFLTKTGRVIVTPCRRNTVVARRKLKAFKRMCEAGEVTLTQVITSYSSYRGSIKEDFNSHKTVRSMDKLFHELFGYGTPICRKENF